MQEVMASYTQAQRKLDQMQTVLKQFTINAPKAGMVIYRRNWDGNKQGIGSTLNAWENVVAELPDLSKMISKTYVNEIDISKIKVNQLVRIGIDAFPEKKFTGKVTKLPISVNSFKTPMPKFSKSKSLSMNSIPFFALR